MADPNDFFVGVSTPVLFKPTNYLRNPTYWGPNAYYGQQQTCFHSVSEIAGLWVELWDELLADNGGNTVQTCEDVLQLYEENGFLGQFYQDTTVPLDFDDHYELRHLLVKNGTSFYFPTVGELTLNTGVATELSNVNFTMFFMNPTGAPNQYVSNGNGRENRRVYLIPSWSSNSFVYGSPPASPFSLPGYPGKNFLAITTTSNCGGSINNYLSYTENVELANLTDADGLFAYMFPLCDIGPGPGPVNPANGPYFGYVVEGIEVNKMPLRTRLVYQNYARSFLNPLKGKK